MTDDHTSVSHLEMVHDQPHCPRCGARLFAPFENPCARCVLAGALEGDDDDESPGGEGEGGGPRVVGDHELLERIGRGGAGVVWRARHVPLDRIVALKMIHGGAALDDEDLRRFRDEARTVAALHHPGIVPVYAVGEHHGVPWIAMRYCAGGTLAALPRATPRRAAEMVAAIARAVAHAHRHGVLHLDLKPANILLGEDGAPVVADFGLARRLDAATRSATTAGTPAYMAPERIVRGEATVAVDVYGIGAVLYELLTGAPPARGATAVQVLRSVVDGVPVRPRALAPAVPRDLETVCLKCLEKAPDARYRSVDEVADDLDRFLAGGTVHARNAGLARRALRWALQRPAWAGAAVAFASVLVFVAAMATFFARDLQHRLENESLVVNRFAARALSDGVALKLRDLADIVLPASEDEALREALRDEDGAGAAPWNVAADLFGRGFESVVVLDAEGRWLARAPLDARLFAPEAPDFSYRDYFTGARDLWARGTGGIHVARAFRSEMDGQYRFSVSAPIDDGEARFLGAIVVQVSTDSAWGPLRVEGEPGPGRTAMIVSKRDRERDEHVVPDEHVVVVHERLVPGRGVPIRTTALAALAADETVVDRSFVDPIDGRPGHAALARVNGTPLVVIVETATDAAARPAASLRDELLQACIAAGGLGAAVAAALALAARRREVRGA